MASLPCMPPLAKVYYRVPQKYVSPVPKMSSLPHSAFYAIYAYCACCVDTDEQAVLSMLVAPPGDKITPFLVANFDLPDLF